MRAVILAAVLCAVTLWEAAGGAIGSGVGSAGNVVVCYASTWAAYRPGKGKFEAQHVDPSLCTHLVYAFAGLHAPNSSIVPLDRWNDLEENGGRGSFRKFTQLRSQRPDLKVTLAIGGWNEGSRNYSDMAATPDTRRRFVDSVVRILKEHDFDGLDLDWEYPTKRDGKPEDRKNFVQLTKDLRQAFDSEERTTGRRWLLTSAIGAALDTLKDAYDLPALGHTLDLLHVMGYDYHGSWDPSAGPNAPLRATHTPGDTLSLENTIDFMLSAGAPANKIVLGIPAYGRTFIARDETAHLSLGTPTMPEGFAGPFTNEKGFMGYNEICWEMQVNASKWHEHWDDRSATPYAVRDSKLVAFDNPRSVEMKVRFAKKRKLAGVMVWAIDTDDFMGDCSQTTKYKNYPLLRTINEALKVPDESENEIDSNEQKEGSGSICHTLSLSLLAFSLLVFTTHKSYLH